MPYLTEAGTWTEVFLIKQASQRFTLHRSIFLSFRNQTWASPCFYVSLYTYLNKGWVASALTYSKEPLELKNHIVPFFDLLMAILKPNFIMVSKQWAFDVWIRLWIDWIFLYKTYNPSKKSNKISPIEILWSQKIALR